MTRQRTNRYRFLVYVSLLTSLGVLGLLLRQLAPPLGLRPRVEVSPVALKNVSGISFDGRRLWITVDGSGKVYRVHPESGEIEREIDLPVKETGGSAWDGESLWQLAYAERKIYRLDVESGEILGTLPSPGEGMCSGMSFDGEHLWLANWSEEKIYRIDPARGGEVVDVYRSDLETTGLAWDGAYLWNGVLVGTEDHDEETPYTGFVQQRDVDAQRTLQVLPVHGVFAGGSDWTPGAPKARRMWWYDGYHERLLQLTFRDRTEIMVRSWGALLVALNLLTGGLVWYHDRKTGRV